MNPNLLFLLLVGVPIFFLIVFLLLKKSDEKQNQDLRIKNKTVSALQKRLVELEAEKGKLSAILDHMAEGVIAVNSGKQILAINPSAEAFFSLKNKSVSGKALIEVVRNQRIDDMMDQAIHNRTVAASEIELHHPKKMILRAGAVGVSGEGDAIAGILVLYDVTEMRRLENLRRDFVANVSHELKTPLTSIKGFIETLLGGALEDSKQSERFLKMMEEDASRLTRLIDDLLELSKIESKETNLKLESIVLKSEVDKVLAAFQPRLIEKRITVENGVSENHMPHVLADRDQLKQVLVNLIDNAVKFNREDGRIVITAKPLENQIQVSIEDTGSGIPKESISRIFERFFRVDQARSRKDGGTGLGLAIVKHIIEAHGGTVSCESKLDRGSQFSFTLPIARS